ncbi:MAG: glutaminyl-peptide cyclotransferase [Deltaproteobacteria bacterium]|jgi:glutamine cyclotransferase|nr:glutaminyl-peptide cyclotransferase [Deltaproteobacteria bacterium]
MKNLPASDRVRPAAGPGALVLVLAAVLAFLPVFRPACLRAAEVFEAQIIRELSHDSQCFTQGLFFDGLVRYETCGLYEASRIIKYDAEGRRVLAKDFPGTVFAEGAVLAEGTIYVLTWQEGRVFLLDPETLETKKTLFLPRESWGLTFDGQKLWRSDGSHRLWPHRLDTLAAAGPAVEVRDGPAPAAGLNELEYDPVSGLILANIYGDSKIAFIDPGTGLVRYYLDARRLLRSAPPNPEAVLNGIARDGSDRLYLTGKLWPVLFETAWPKARSPR